MVQKDLKMKIKGLWKKMKKEKTNNKTANKISLNKTKIINQTKVFLVIKSLKKMNKQKMRIISKVIKI